MCALGMANEPQRVEKSESPHIKEYPAETELITGGRAFIRSQRGAPLLVKDNFIYRCERTRGNRSYWLCVRYKSYKCTGRIICQGNAVMKQTGHTHQTDHARLAQSTKVVYDLTKINLTSWIKAAANQQRRRAAARIERMRDLQIKLDID
ncbi:AGAP003439-PN-like protein [Anopheles sinensis]|uniref:AGAP003439-PN-like protein n=1 Tax=Anopheles sinensis TaxID=74873 RepID=A0A084WSS7_ANOSI|nr:AGAP003439-PN-like protein [Anopheles sinensis]